MSILACEFTFALEAEEAALQYHVDGVEASRWVYTNAAGGSVLMSAFSGVTGIALQNSRSLFFNTGEWIKFIKGKTEYYHTRTPAEEDYTVEVERDGSGVQLKLTVGGVIIRDDTWTAGTNTVDRAARAEVSISWGMMLAWQRASLEFVKMIEEYVASHGQVGEIPPTGPFSVISPSFPFTC